MRMAQPNTTFAWMHTYTVSNTKSQYPYDPGTLPSSANQCILGNVYLRSNLSRKHNHLDVSEAIIATKHTTYAEPDAQSRAATTAETATVLGTFVGTVFCIPFLIVL